MSYQATISLAKAYLAKVAANEAVSDASAVMRDAERVQLPLNESYTVQVGNKLVTVTRRSTGYDYLVSKPVEAP